jgi:adenosylcobinamide-phosphate synthase
MAGALGVRLGGPSTYGGIVCEKPWIGDGGSDDYLSASSRALTLVGLSSVVAAGIAVLAIHLRGLS